MPNLLRKLREKIRTKLRKRLHTKVSTPSTEVNQGDQAIVVPLQDLEPTSPNGQFQSYLTPSHDTSTLPPFGSTQSNTAPGARQASEQPSSSSTATPSSRNIAASPYTTALASFSHLVASTSDTLAPAASNTGEGVEETGASKPSSVSNNPLTLAQRFILRDAPVGSALGDARDKLDKAYEELEAVLQKIHGKSSLETVSCLEKYLQPDTGFTRPLEFESLMEAMQQDQKAKEKTVKAKLQRHLATLYPLAKLALNLTGGIAAAAQSVPARITANGLVQVLELLMRPSMESSKVKSGLDILTQDQSFLRELQLLTETTLEEALLICAVDLQTELVSFLRVSILWLRKSDFNRFMTCAIEDKNIDNAMKTLTKARDRLTGAASRETYLLVKRREKLVSHAGVLRMVCPDKFHELQLNTQARLHSKRVEGTGRWFLQHDRYLRFRGGELEALWCPGQPGAGKSFIAANIVDDLLITARHTDIAIAFIFCQYQHSSQQTPLLVINAIIRQLVAQKPDLISNYRSALEMKAASLDDRRKLLVRIVKDFDEVLVVCDALDEFSSDIRDRRKVAGQLVRIAVEVGNKRFRFCITSREAPDVEAQLLSINTESIIIQAPDNDIEKIICETIDNLEDQDPIREMMRIDPELEAYVHHQIVTHCRGIAKLAALQLHHALHGSRPSEVRKMLMNLTSHIDDYYNYTRERLLSPRRPRRDQEIVQRLLTWLFYCRGPITDEELKFALGIDRDTIEPGTIKDVPLTDVRPYIGACEGLVSVFEKRRGWHLLWHKERWFHTGASVVKISHETAMSFVGQHPELLLSSGRTTILDACLAVVSYDPFLATINTHYETHPPGTSS